LTVEAAVTPLKQETRRPGRGWLWTGACTAFLSLLGIVRYGMQAEVIVVVFTIGVLAAISKYDLESHIIPNRIVLPAWLVVLLAQLIIYPNHWLEWVVASFGAALFFLAVQLAYPAGLGMGDVKLALLLGAALGWSVSTALVLGTLAAGLVSAGLLLAHGAKARKKAIPLGPFLAAGAVVVLLFL
jgi:leader peptidase (prepilin peptidase) / N-methyltransferase